MLRDYTVLELLRRLPGQITLEAGGGVPCVPFLAAGIRAPPTLGPPVVLPPVPRRNHRCAPGIKPVPQILKVA